MQDSAIVQGKNEVQLLFEDGGGGGAALTNKCNNSHILQNKSILLKLLKVWGGIGISVLGPRTKVHDR